ncbi:hypothetical protein K439DRAFT_1659611 [Ramaria rubella]|nr:hypothetical protein K439DRAFT_1659611 [Ramaria rubella]
MFTILSALAVVGGALPLIKQSTDKQNKPARPPIDPTTAALLAIKSLSLSLPHPIAAHGLSKVTTPPSILVPAHTPSPPMSDIQVLAALLAAARKHALNRSGSQSLYVSGDGLDMGIWVGPISAGNVAEDGIEGSDEWKKRVAGCVIEGLTGGKAKQENVSSLAAPVPLPPSTSSDDALQKVLALLDAYFVFSLPSKQAVRALPPKSEPSPPPQQDESAAPVSPKKDGVNPSPPPKDECETQAFLFVGRNAQSKNWIAVGAATGGADVPRPEDKGGQGSGEIAGGTGSENDGTDSGGGNCRDKPTSQPPPTQGSRANENNGNIQPEECELTDRDRGVPENSGSTRGERGRGGGRRRGRGTGRGEGRGRQEGGQRRQRRRTQNVEEPSDQREESPQPQTRSQRQESRPESGRGTHGGRATARRGRRIGRGGNGVTASTGDPGSRAGNTELQQTRSQLEGARSGPPRDRPEGRRRRRGGRGHVRGGGNDRHDGERAQTVNVV